MRDNAPIGSGAPEPDSMRAPAWNEVRALPRQMVDLRTFLASIEHLVYRPAGALPVVHGITALQHALEQAGRRPVIRVDRPVLPDGRASAIPVVTNLTASRAVTAAALGIADHRDAARILAGRAAAPVAPEVVGRDAAPVQSRIDAGEAVDLTLLPALVQHELDAGPYLTAAHATTVDPDTGIDNTAIQRCWVRGPRELTWYPYPSSHNARNLRKAEARGEICPVVLWIGHHPAVSIGAQSKLGYPESHWGAAGAIAGAPVRLAPSISFGPRLMVPADAEIVIEGQVRPGARIADGPFGEYTGYLGPQTLASRLEVLCVTRRDDAIYHDYASGLADMLVPDNMAMEGRLYALVRAVAPSLVNVHVPVSGRRFHACLQLEDPAPGEVRDALAAALAYRRVKAAFAVDRDVDIFSEAEMMWALATRVQWRRDAFILDGMSGSSLDPSWPAGARTTSKLAVDATLPAAARPDRPKPFAPRARVPAASLDAARRILAGADPSQWPQL